ncbi:MAG: hypothetical protein AAF787_02870 [Chloroflexota bacterium]
MINVSHHAYNPCHICGSEDFSWGIATAKGSQVQIVFRYEKTPLESKRGFEGRTIGRVFVEGELIARRCNVCGNLQNFAVIDEKAQKKKRG